MRTSLYSQTLLVEALPYDEIDSDTTTAGTAVDLGIYKNNFRDSVLFIARTGAVADGNFVFSLEESDTAGSGYTAVPAARIEGTAPVFTSASDSVTKAFGYIPAGFRYVRLSIVSTATTDGGWFGADALLSGAAVTPVARA